MDEIKIYNDIKNEIRFAFNDLITKYGYREVTVNPPTSEIYSEIHYAKGDWKLGIKTTAHGSKISLSLISIDNVSAFLSYYFQNGNNKYSDSTVRLSDNIKYNSKFMFDNCNELLDGNDSELKYIFDLCLTRQKEFIKKYFQ